VSELVQQTTVSAIDLESMVSSLSLKGHVGLGQFLAATLMLDSDLASRFVTLDTVNLRNSLNMVVPVVDDELAGYGASLITSPVDPADVIEANWVELASLLHYLEVYGARPIQDRRGVGAAYPALRDGATAIADFRQETAKRRATGQRLRQFATEIGVAFAQWAGFTEKEIGELAAG